ncbi:hypothetical protein AXF42_Ash008281 [Apostasia shenzhenica]|uniref:Uncharacterized protein n=1 Tax=Apostasia shenzhenica TaxID=1088818 RepID=A0A2I0AXE6_9ASPA|nr:hypothetical protein AXF42_Ash008281 [Apostasia shenzhenica]
MLTWARSSKLTICAVDGAWRNSFKSKVACENSNFVQSNIRMKGEPPFDVSEIEAAMDVTQEPICSGVICDIERAVIGVVVAQRNEDKTSCVSSKQWVGNGFPNSTSKYKEDQKVSWHATPFEVRLDKVLSDEKLHQQRYSSLLLNFNHTLLHLLFTRLSNEKIRQLLVLPLELTLQTVCRAFVL